jgi:hypothetical protein
MSRIVRGNTVEEKLDSIDLILSRMIRRAHQTVVVAHPAIPFSVFSQGVVVGNTLGAFSFPVPCVLSSLSTFVESLQYKKGVISISIFSGLEKREYSYLLKQGKTALTFKEAIKADDRVVFKLTSADFGNQAPEAVVPTIDTIWISFLCETDVSGMKKEEVLIDALDQSTAIAEA